MAADYDEHEGHSVLTEFWEVFSDPAHILAEAASALIWDILVFVLLLPFIRWYLRRFRARVHAEIDAEHGVTHDVEHDHEPKHWTQDPRNQKRAGNRWL